MAADGDRRHLNWSSAEREKREADEFVTRRIKNVAEFKTELQTMRDELQEILTVIDDIDSKRDVVTAELRNLGDWARNKRNEYLYDEIGEDHVAINRLIKGGEGHKGMIEHIDELLKESKEVDASARSGNAGDIIGFKTKARQIIVNDLYPLWGSLKRSFGRVEHLNLTMIQDVTHLEENATKEIEEYFLRFHSKVYEQFIPANDEDFLYTLLELLKTLENVRGDYQEAITSSFKRRAQTDEVVELDDCRIPARMKDLDTIINNYFRIYNKPIWSRFEEIMKILKQSQDKVISLSGGDRDKVFKLYEEFRLKLLKNTGFSMVFKHFGKLVGIHKAYKITEKKIEDFARRMSDIGITHDQVGTIALFDLPTKEMEDMATHLLGDMQTGAGATSEWGAFVRARGKGDSNDYTFDFKANNKTKRAKISYQELVKLMARIDDELDERDNKGLIFSKERYFYYKTISAFLDLTSKFLDEVQEGDNFELFCDRQPDTSALERVLGEDKFEKAKTNYERVKDELNKFLDWKQYESAIRVESCTITVDGKRIRIREDIEDKVLKGQYTKAKRELLERVVKRLEDIANMQNSNTAKEVALGIRPGKSPPGSRGTGGGTTTGGGGGPSGTTSSASTGSHTDKLHDDEFEEIKETLDYIYHCITNENGVDKVIDSKQAEFNRLVGLFMNQLFGPKNAIDRDTGECYQFRMVCNTIRDNLADQLEHNGKWQPFIRDVYDMYTAILAGDMNLFFQFLHKLFDLIGEHSLR